MRLPAFLIVGEEEDDGESAQEVSSHNIGNFDSFAKNKNRARETRLHNTGIYRRRLFAGTVNG